MLVKFHSRKKRIQGSKMFWREKIWEAKKIGSKFLEAKNFWEKKFGEQNFGGKKILGQSRHDFHAKIIKGHNSAKT